MNTKKHRWILYLISFTIFATIAIQLYWNFKNYQQNKQRVINEIQQSLDNAVEEYYVTLTKQNFFAIIKNENEPHNFKKIFKELIPSPKKRKTENKQVSISSISITKDNHQKGFKTSSIFLDSIFTDSSNRLKKFPEKKLTKTTTLTNFLSKPKTRKNTAGEKKLKIFKGKKATDSLKLIKGLETIFISIQNDSLNYTKLDSLIKKQLTSKKIITPFYTKHYKQDTLFFTSKNENTSELPLKSEAKSTYLKTDEKLFLQYKNPTYVTLKRSFIGIVLSLLLSLAVIASLFYLLTVITQQKQLAEIKNDLISNITHEFKTPITTVSTALEAIHNFNAINDKEKTKKYLNISTKQLEKLQVMVEKLLETATLDSEKLLLKKTPVNLVELLTNNVKKHQFTNSEKTIRFTTNIPQIVALIDVFHFENAISNLLDNAIKYGGNTIEVHCKKILNKIEITVSDNGKGIDKQQQEKIFDKFYRIPKGNTHDVKGFGIGLYYSKKIIEKHGGSISLTSKPNSTRFKIVLNYE